MDLLFLLVTTRLVIKLSLEVPGNRAHRPWQRGTAREFLNECYIKIKYLLKVFVHVYKKQPHQETNDK